MSHRETTATATKAKPVTRNNQAQASDLHPDEEITFAGKATTSRKPVNNDEKTHRQIQGVDWTAAKTSVQVAKGGESMKHPSNAVAGTGEAWYGVGTTRPISSGGLKTAFERGSADGRLASPLSIGTTRGATVHRQTGGEDNRLEQFNRVMTKELKLTTLEKAQIIEMFKALNHPSAMWNEHQSRMEFQRWEWIGDSLLNFCVSSMLLHANPTNTEAELSRKRTLFVRESNLAECARRIGLADNIVILQDNAVLTDGILADVVEALIGQCFLVCGMETARKMVASLVDLSKERIQTNPALNPKATLQEWCVAAFGVSPQYELLSRTGPDHKPEFKSRVRVIVNGKVVNEADGSGSSRQQSEESAASQLFDDSMIASSSSSTSSVTNPKGLLQEKTIGILGVPIEYTLVPKLGPSNAPFIVKAGAPGWHIEQAFGMTKKDAEAAAAHKLLALLEGDKPLSSLPQASQRRDETDERSTGTVSVSSSVSQMIANPKGKLQEVFQAKGILPRYVLVEQTGEDHTPLFTINVHLGDDPNPIAEGRGGSKKEAEKEAARRALQNLQII